jgi:hypothetical protein
MGKEPQIVGVSLPATRAARASSNILVVSTLWHPKQNGISIAPSSHAFSKAQQANQASTIHVLDSQTAARFARGLFAGLGTKRRRLKMTLTGGCFCGALRYEISGEIPMRALCLCETCQKISGGAGNLFIGIEAGNFRYTQGEPRRFTRAEGAPTRDFCGECGVHIAARSPKAPGGIVVKVGTLDDTSIFEGPKMVFWTQAKRSFHLIPDGVAAFNTLPGR